MTPVQVFTKNILNFWTEDGCLGTDFILNFDRVIVNYKNMFIDIK